jgi:outer membrane protein assembly factor BamB
MPDGGVTVRKESKCHDGYTLYSSRFTERAHLIDMAGREVHRWSYEQGQTWHYAEMLPDGHLVAIIKEDEGRFPGLIFELDRESRLVWRAEVAAHHDFDRLTTGNTLVVCREYVENGKIRPGTLKSDCILEITPNSEVAWEWHADRHAEEMAELVPVELPAEHRDWAHTNTVEALPDGPAGRRDERFRAGNVLFSCRHTDTIGVIDKATGRLVWAWGPGVLDRQHMPTMLPSGNLLVFDNGSRRGYSRVVELDPVSERITWEYRASPPEDFFTTSRGANERLANGNTFITESNTGRLFEVTAEGELVWEFINPDLKEDGTPMPLYRALRYERETVERLFGDDA